MTRTITALFDTRADAEAGRERLREADLDAHDIDIYDRSSLGGSGYGLQDGAGIWAAHKHAFLPHEDRQVYEEGLRRGGFLLMVDVDDDDVDAAVAVLEESHLNSVDIDERAQQWRSQGWVPAATAAGMTGNAGMGAGMQQSSSMSSQSGNLQGGIARSDSLQRDTSAARIPVVEEQLKIGKREVQRGGVRVYSRIVETPVNESIELREEHVKVERRPVDRPVSPAEAAAFEDRSIEVRATAEEAVVQKSARIVEEVSISKQVVEREETVRDTVRRTEVDVERIDGTAGSDRTNDAYYRDHFNSNYASSGASYDDYAPAYSYGSQMRGDSRYSGRQWDSVESDLRTDWESRYAGSGSTWEKMKAAVRHGWDRMTGSSDAGRP